MNPTSHNQSELKKKKKKQLQPHVFDVSTFIRTTVDFYTVSIKMVQFLVTVC